MARGHKRRRGDAWELRASAGSDPVTGRRRVVTRTFRGTAAQADKALTKLLGELDGGAHRGPDASLGTLLDRWWSHSRSRWAPATRRGYAAYRRTYLADHERMRLAQITPEWIDSLYADLLTSKAPSTVYKVHTILHDALDDAVRWGWLVWNPADRAEAPHVRRRPVVVPVAERIRAGVAAMVADDVNYAAMLHVQAVTGLRRAELAGLQWGDLADGRLTIRRTVVIDERGRVLVQADTKSHRARSIDLDPYTLALLDWHRACWQAWAAEDGYDLDAEHFVFPRWDDAAQAMTPDQISQRWRRWRGRLDLDGVRMHDFRHAMVTRLLDQGIPVHDVAARAGHANGNVTLAIYAHPTTEGARRAGEAARL